jgi:ADP-ribose pyrophosphatase YjhB (NUDIX family)
MTNVQSVPPAFCPSCGGPLQQRFISEELRDRLVCEHCERIHYINPAIVAGVIPVTDGGVWLLRRAIEPRYGTWTFPAGFMELGETVEEAAMRETREELNLDVRIERLFGVYSRSTLTTVHVVYLAEALGTPSVGHETLAFERFAPDAIPWDELSFWTTTRALQDWVESLG